jgi:hypothetical protein
VIEWIRESEGSFVDAEVKATLAKGQTPVEAVEACRNRMGELASEKRDVLKQPLPFEDALARVIADVDAEARSIDVRPAMRLKAQASEWVTPRVKRKPDAQGHIEFPSRAEIVEGGRHVEMDQGNALICWVFRNQVIERCTAELKKQYGNAKGVSAEERARRVAEIDAAILAEERREEAYIRMAEDAGQTIWRRPLANPLAVLGVAPKN